MPGTWTFEMFGEGRKLAEVSFQVMAGAESPTPRSDDSECFQMSAVRRPARRPS